MKTVDGWVMQDVETSGFHDIRKEWQNKHQKVLSYCKNTRRVVQAGGNIGIFPKGLSSFFTHVETFEPVDSNWDCLIENMWNGNVSCYKYALGEEVGSAEVSNTIVGNSGATQLRESHIGTIQVRPLDIFNFEDVDLLWLDVEGFEVKALLGARETIKKYSPVIVAENNGLIHEFPGDRLKGSQEFRDWMKQELGYIFVGRLMRDDIFIKEEEN